MNKISKLAGPEDMFQIISSCEDVDNQCYLKSEVLRATLTQ